MCHNIEHSQEKLEVSEMKCRTCLWFSMVFTESTEFLWKEIQSSQCAMQAASKELLPTELKLPPLRLFKNRSPRKGNLLKMEQAKRVLLGQLSTT